MTNLEIMKAAQAMIINPVGTKKWMVGLGKEIGTGEIAKIADKIMSLYDASTLCQLRKDRSFPDVALFINTIVNH